MHRRSEYNRFYSECYMKARELVEKLARDSHPFEKYLFEFLQRHCYYGYPNDTATKFEAGDWLFPAGKPVNKKKGIAWIMCLPGDVIPVKRVEDKIGNHSASYSSGLRAIVMFDVNHWSPLELAATFLHEGYHAYRRLSRWLDGVMPSGTDATEETDAWIIVLNLIEAEGGRLWQEIIKREMRKLDGTKIIPNEKGGYKLDFKKSETDWPEFNRIFGHTKNKAVKDHRRYLASLKAHMSYWSKLKPDLSPQAICHAIISQEYDNVLKQL